MSDRVIARNGKFEIYKSEGSERFNLRKEKKFIRGFRTLEEARFVMDNKAAQDAGGSRVNVI